MAKNPYAVPAMPAVAKVSGPSSPKAPAGKQLGSNQLGMSPRKVAIKVPKFNKGG